MTPPPAQIYATVLLDELVRAGLRHVVVSPGSRSAPLAYAALAAERAGLARLHVRIDERSAAFLALGVGKASGTPAAVVTTSGTAVANCHPAVLEAHESRVPLLLLTADRPHELRPTRANQTTRQPDVFGRAVRLSLDLEAPVLIPGEPEDETRARAAYWRATTDRAMAAATGAAGGLPGPVHLNIALRDPLAPVPGRDGLVSLTAPELPEPYRGREAGGAWTEIGAPAPTATGTLPHVPRTLVVLGEAPAGLRADALAWAARRGHPVLAEPFGCLGEAVVPHGPLLAETAFASAPASVPERVLVVGRLTLSRAVAALVRRAPRRDIVTADPVWTDPGHVMHAVHAAASLRPEPGAPPVGPASDAHGTDTEARRFAALWHEAGVRVSSAVARRVAENWPSGPAVSATVLAALPHGARLFLGSSSTVRDVGFVRAADAVDTVASRGLAGIDGCVSTAAGMALGDRGTPMYALVGDLTFLHDAAALTVGPLEKRPDLTVVVVNDDGGAIFDTLEYGAEPLAAGDPEAYRRLFTTPTGAHLGHLCAAAGARHFLARTPAELTDALRPRPSGLCVVEVRLPGTRARAERAALVGAADTALAGLT